MPENGYVPQFIAMEEPNGDFKTVEASFLNGQPMAGGEPEPAGVARVSSWRALRKHSWIFTLGLATVAVVLLILSVNSRRAPSTIAPPRNEGIAVAGTLPIVPDGEALRIAAGSSMPKYIDSNGSLWLSDRYFHGGEEIARPLRRIFRTLDQDLYRAAREGDFSYDIPLKPGLYELHLHFAEIVYGQSSFESSGDGQRRFNIAINGRNRMIAFDIVRDAGGPNTADEVVITAVTPAGDGFLHLGFSSVLGKPLLSSLEILLDRSRAMFPIRLVAGSKPYFDTHGNLWDADRYFLGGSVTRYTAEVEGTDDPKLYTTERWGRFSYALPVAPGTYALRLRFSERSFGLPNFSMPGNEQGGIGSRVFDIYCNGQLLLKDLDIFSASGGANRALVRTFHDLSPNAFGKLELSFEPIYDYATVSAIEVLPEPESMTSRTKIQPYPPCQH